MAYNDKHLSIIVAAYNQEKEVRRCLASVIAQENADLQIECVIVDDCSTDSTLDIIRAMVHAYTGNITFRMFRHKTHRGLSVVRNTGLRQAQGGYVMFINASDYLAPDSIDYFTEHLMRYWDMDVIVGNTIYGNEEQTRLRELSGPVALRGDGTVMLRQMISYDFFMFAWNKLVRHDLLVEKGILFDESVPYADVLWNYTLFRNVSAVLLLPNPTYNQAVTPPAAITVAEKQANALVQSFVISADKMLDSAPRPQQNDTNDFYINHQLFIFSLLKTCDDIIMEYTVNSQLRREQGNVRKRLASQTRGDGQKTLAMYISSAGTSIGGLLRLPAYRRYDTLVAHLTGQLQKTSTAFTPIYFR